jgi:hypothetical protein
MIEHFWPRVHGCFTFHDFYRWTAIDSSDEWHGVEVGALYGQSAAYLGVELLNQWSKHVGPRLGKTRLDLVELSSAEGIIRSNLAPVASVIGAIHSPCSSVDAAAKYEDGTLDFVMLDGDHSLSGVRADIAAWWPKLKAGAILSGHDFAHYFPGVMRAALEAFPQLNVWRGSVWPDESVAADRLTEVHADFRNRSAHGGTDDFLAVWWVRK